METVQPWQRALLLVIGGILLELGDDRGAAEDLWRQVARRFPADRVHEISKLAATLAEGEGVPDLAERLPYDTFNRCEVFYWVGLLLEHRGEKRQARAVLTLAASEDPTLRWPTALARGRLKA
jgi:hypothetical protein